MRITIIKYITALFFVVTLFSCQKEAAQFVNTDLRPPTVDAGTTRLITAPANFDTLTGTAISYNGPIMGYLWSLISGPSVPLIESPSSKITKVSFLGLGTYRFQFAAIDSAGLTGIDTVSIIVKQNPQDSIVLMPINNPFEKHVNNLIDLPGNGGDSSLLVGAWTIGGSPSYWRQFIKFDYSQIPANAIIDGATLTLNAIPIPAGGNQVSAHFGTANAFAIERVTTNWVTFDLRWSVQPNVTNQNSVTVPQSTISFENSVVDVTNLVRDMRANGNYGFRLKLLNEAIYNMRQYASSTHRENHLRPRLVVRYH
jgi:hypothetical protein